MTTPRNIGAYFGEPWPSGICDSGNQVPTPIDEECEYCDQPIGPESRGSFVGSFKRDGLRPVHRECSLRSVLGGIGHLEDHQHWCLGEHDPDAGRSYRESSLLVWDWFRAGKPIPQ